MNKGGTTNVFVDLRISTKQRDLALKLVETIVAEGVGTIRRLNIVEGSKAAQDALLSFDGLAKKLRETVNRKSPNSEFDGHEILMIEWPEGEESGAGHIVELFFKFCADNKISIGQQLIILAMFDAAGVDLGAVISEQQFGAAMERMKERTEGKLKYHAMDAHTDERRKR